MGCYGVLGGIWNVFCVRCGSSRAEKWTSVSPWHVVVIERGALSGREQEWNISRPELESLVRLGVLTQPQLEESITKEFNPIKCGFYGSDSPPMVTKDILNIGVKPSRQGLSVG